MNQAIGRVIRHISDYGSILLVDERYENFKDMISKWLKDQINIPKSNAEALKNMEHFFAEMKSRNYVPKARDVGDMVDQADISEDDDDEDEN